MKLPVPFENSGRGGVFQINESGQPIETNYYIYAIAATPEKRAIAASSENNKIRAIAATPEKRAIAPASEKNKIRAIAPTPEKNKSDRPCFRKNNSE